ncbi:MAG: S-methyl-5'-thioadenosine phosphorylase [Candidatus Omnitrophota bacterium]
MEKGSVGIIGGSGIYNMGGMSGVEELNIDTPFGKPSDSIISGKIEGVKVAFLPRHGRGHFISPSELNFRANIYAMKKIGVEKLISISAVGSLKEKLKPRDFVIPDQLYDRTKTRVSTFFTDGIVAHIGMADPFCKRLSTLLIDSCKEAEISVHKGGTYVCIEGPQFSTRAESNVYRRHGFSIIGMTAIPEAKLAREAEMCYATVALVTDYDVWHEEDVSIEQVLANLAANTQNAQKLIKTIIPRLKDMQECTCQSALQNAIITAKEKKNNTTAKKLELLIKKYLK